VRLAAQAAAEPEAEAPAGLPPSRENENLAKSSHKTPARDELADASMIGLANQGSLR
jgi:hypothetical protein